MTYFPTAPKVDRHVGLTRIHAPRELIAEAITTVLAAAVDQDQVELLTDLADAAALVRQLEQSGPVGALDLARRALVDAQDAVMSELLDPSPVSIDLSRTTAVELAGEIALVAFDRPEAVVAS